MRSNTISNFVTALVAFAAISYSVTPVVSGNSNRNADSAIASPSPSLPRFTPADLAKLKWIEGDWKGTGEGLEPFYEPYRFENGTTLAVESFDDADMTKKSDITRYILRNGEFRTERDGSGYSASEITNDSASFVPFGGAKNSFKFQRQGDHSWKATLDWPAVGAKPARQKIYLMVRLEQKK